MTAENALTFYTYFHTRNDTNAVFYIGKGCGYRAHVTRRNNPHWNHIVAKHGHTVHIAARWPTNDEANEHEKFLISCFRSMGCSLVNITDGGEGTLGRKQTEDAKRRISIANTGRKMSPEWIAKIRASVTGRVFSDEHRKRLSDSTKGRKKPQAEIDGYLPALRAAMARPEVRAKMSAIAKTRSFSVETRARMSQTRTGMKASPETRAKMSESAKALAEKRHDKGVRS